MILQRLTLRTFRNYEALTLEPAPGLNILVGENAQGKSNLLEAIYLLATTKSFRAVHESEAIQDSATEAIISGSVLKDNGSSTDIELVISENERKTARINSAKTARAVDLLGHLHAVFFGALDLRLVTGEPATRRRYMDLAISQTTPAYCSDLAGYKRVLLHRNNLLRRLRDAWFAHSGLEVFSAQLADFGSRLIAKRLSFAVELTDLAGTAHSSLSGGTETLSVRYAPSPNVGSAETPEEIARVFADALSRVADDEVRRGTSLVGPQRDDLRFRINGLEVRTFGSQGQQRTAVLSLKMAELSFMERHTGERPVLLLDDVMSDLDDQRRSRLIERIWGRCQTFVTCTNLRSFPKELLQDAAVFRVAEGHVEPLANAQPGLSAG